MVEPHDQRADFDDGFGALRKPWTVTWAAVFWLMFSLANVALTSYAVIALISLHEELNQPRKPFGSPQYLIEMAIGFFTCLALIGLAAMLIFGLMGLFALWGRLPNLVASTFLSWVVGAGLGSLLLFIYAVNIARYDSRGEVAIKIGILTAYFTPALLGAILATIGRREYIRWKSQLAGPISPQSNSPA